MVVSSERVNAEAAEAAKMPTKSFVEVSKSHASGHTIAVDSNNEAHSYCHSRKCRNELGELGRSGDPFKLLPITIDVDGGNRVRIKRAFAGGNSEARHSALLDDDGVLYVCGSDRWQQLGLGSSNGGSTGYTWKSLWQCKFIKNDFVPELITKLDPSLKKHPIRDVALGGDHTVVLSKNKRDVVTFGKGAEGQLGLSSKPYVSAVSKSKQLSSTKADIAAVCAFLNCSWTLNDNGEVANQTGKCSTKIKGMERALEACRDKAKNSDLVTSA